MSETIRVSVLAHHRPIDQKLGLKIAAKREIKLTPGDMEGVLFSKPTRDWLRIQFQLGRKVELIPNL